MKRVEAEMNQSIGEMEKEMEDYEEEKKALESISTRAVELEAEVLSLQEDLNASLAGVEEVAELKEELLLVGEGREVGRV
uniref:Uncharacterized protein n=2 Tax=Brassica TaxID=3705 RepID=A0A3P6GQR9_BRAOL|nr:unnamed protein product [Brassica oleracea]